MLSRRLVLTSATAFAASASLRGAEAATGTENALKIALAMTFTGTDAELATRMANGGILAFEEANAAAAVPGYSFRVAKFDDGTAAGQSDPAQAAVNARRMVADRSIIAAIGPQVSGAGKAMAPILSIGNLATISPSATNPDLTDPNFATVYRPAGKVTYFRTVATDALQGPNMTNFMANTIKIKTVFVLDDNGAYGVGLADAFLARAKRIGVRVIGRDHLDPAANDYTTTLTRIQQLNPDALYYGGAGMAGAKLARQAYDLIPGIIKAGGDSMYNPSLLKTVGFPAIDGWYATIAAPYRDETRPAIADFSHRYAERFKMQPSNYSVTCYVAAQVIVAAVKQVVAAGKPPTRQALRDAIQTIRLSDSLIGPLEFDANGDIKTRTISVFQIRHDEARPADDLNGQYHYMGVAPMA